MWDFINVRLTVKSVAILQDQEGNRVMCRDVIPTPLTLLHSEPGLPQPARVLWIQDAAIDGLNVGALTANMKQIEN